MKAMQYSGFGGPDVLTLAEVEKPSAKDGEVLIKIKATTVNPFDIKIRSGTMQQVMPIQLPFTPGVDVAGSVESVGVGVTRLKVGDAVFATMMPGGSYAEYIALNEDWVAVQPANVSVDEAAALAVPVVTAYSLLVETAQLQAGQTVLIQGASGGVGSVMVQMAKVLGAYVIGTASSEGVAIVTELGADEVIDYKEQDFTQLVHDTDVVIDLVGGDTQAKSFGVLKKGGKLISSVMPPNQELAEKAGVTAKFVSSAPSYKKLEAGKKMVEEGKIKAGIAKTMTLDEAAEAQELVSKGGLDGKIVLTVS